MENNYHNLQYADDEKTMTYVKAIIKAVNMTHEITAKANLKSKKAKDAIQSQNKEYMWNTLQEYIYHYMQFINQSNRICFFRVDNEYYDRISISEIEKQLNIMIGIVYDYEAKHCAKNELIKKCLEKLLKQSGVYDKKEIELLLL